MRYLFACLKYKCLLHCLDVNVRNREDIVSVCVCACACVSMRVCVRACMCF